MKPRRRFVCQPRVDELTAYVDDQLSPPDRQRVEEWLADHPQAAAELRAHERLQALYEKSAAGDPDWSDSLETIEQGIVEQGKRAHERRLPRWGLVGAVSAAAVLLAVLAANRPQSDPVAPAVPAVLPFPVASMDDVEIISVDAADTDALVVGVLPLEKPIVLMEHGDVELTSIEKDAHADFAHLRWHPEEDDSPMIWAPLVASDSFPSDQDE